MDKNISITNFKKEISNYTVGIMVLSKAVSGCYTDLD
ncbi:hypothetical protein B0P06_001716 [Clostridium saccharoperbutylacetonicum]|nr:hypothetical protein [Clostridium saccharoperbutylacetonicum]